MPELVIDLETQKSFDDIGPRSNLGLLGVSLVGVYEYRSGRFLSFREPELKNLEELLAGSSRVIGFNHKAFDFPVLQPHLALDLGVLPSLDLLEEISRHLGFRVGLDNVAAATLGERKNGDGLKALRLWQEGKLAELAAYCLHDVKLTRDIYEYGKRHGKVFCTQRDGATLTVPVRWDNGEVSICELARQALAQHRRLEILYRSPGGNLGGTPRERSKIDIYHLREPYLEAYCHRRNTVRHFHIDRILEAAATEEVYEVPANFSSTLYHG